jgi:hypothetical protein
MSENSSLSTTKRMVILESNFVIFKLKNIKAFAVVGHLVYLWL